MSTPKLSDTAKDGCEEARYDSVLLCEVEDRRPSNWAEALFFRRPHTRSPDDIATRRSVFDDPLLAPFYFPKKDYENIHRFDHSARWTYREEKALLRKVDWKVIFTVATSFALLSLDSGNLTLANSDNFLSDLHLTTDDYNLGNTLNRLSYLCADLPSQLISKRIGADRWIPTQISLWSIVALCQFWLTGRTSFLICRALLGLLQGGFTPNMILYMSYFYTKDELPIRLSILYMTIVFFIIASNFMAYGIFHLDGVAGKAGWRWLFLIDGLITLLMGAVTFFHMPPSPTQTRTWFRPKGWFTEREEVIIVNKILRDDPTKGDMHNREGLTLKKFWIAITDYDLWPVYVLGFMSMIPVTPPSAYLTLLLRYSGFNTFDTNLLAIPHLVISTITTFLITILSERISERTLTAMIQNLWILPFLVALYALPPSPSPWLIFGLLTGLLSNPYSFSIQIAWCSANSGAVATRGITAALYNMFTQVGLIAASQIYVASDAPRYERGNRNLIVICAVNAFVLFPAAKAYYIWRNHQRAKIWDAMTPEEKKHYLNTTTDARSKRLDFRFTH